MYGELTDYGLSRSRRGCYQNALVARQLATGIHLEVVEGVFQQCNKVVKLRRIASHLGGREALRRREFLFAQGLLDWACIRVGEIGIDVSLLLGHLAGTTLVVNRCDASAEVIKRDEREHQ